MSNALSFAIAPFSGIPLIGDLLSPPAPPRPAPPPKPPGREDSVGADAGKKQREAELRRRGRKATIITGGSGITTDAPLSQPKAGAPELLGT